MSIDGKILHDTYIAQTPPNGTYYLELNISLDDNLNKTIDSRLKAPTSKPNALMFNELMPLEKEVQNWLDTPVGFLDVELQPTTHIDMAINGSYLANFINQIQLDASNADISVTSFANSIKGFNKEVTVRDITSTYMFPNTLSILKVTGKILKLALERSASYIDNSSGELKVSDLFLKPKVEHYNYDYFSNIEYTFDITKPIGARVTSVSYTHLDVYKRQTFTFIVISSL